MPIESAIHLFDAQIKDNIDFNKSGIYDYMDDNGFNGLQCGGDWLNCDALHGWQHKNPENIYWDELREEISDCNKILDIICKILKKAKKKWWMGNHEMRIKHFLAQYGPSKRYEKGTEWYQNNKSKIPDLVKELKLKERGFEIYNQMDIGTYGKLHTYHGDDYSEQNEKKNVLLYGASIMYGHVHRPGRYTKVSPITNDPISGWAMPCLCNRNPEWKHGKANAWSQGFGVSFVRNGGYFNLYTVDIIHNQFVAPNGKLYGREIK